MTASTSEPGAPPEEPPLLRPLAPVAVLAEHRQGRGWTVPRPVPREILHVGIAAGALQHGLSVFEGLKAERGPDGSVALFRADLHAQRLRGGAARLCLPDPGAAVFTAAVTEAVRAQEDLVPAHGKGALYLRPTLLAVDEGLGLEAGRRHLLCTVAAVAPARPPAPLALWIDEELVRMGPGGLATAKTAANFAAAIFGRERARRHGCDDALWLDGRWRRDVTSTGTMNLFARIGDVLVTPALDGSVLPGVTRASCLALLADRQDELGLLAIEERPLAFAELCAAHAQGRLREVFGTGTSSGVRSVVELGHAGGRLTPPEDALARRLRSELGALANGSAPDRFGWRAPLAPAPRRAAGAEVGRDLV